MICLLPCEGTSGLTRFLLLLLLNFMAVGNHKCCITTICWTVSCPIYSGTAMACLKRNRMEMFLNSTACGNNENHKQCLKGYPSNLPATMCERGFILWVHKETLIQKAAQSLLVNREMNEGPLMNLSRLRHMPHINSCLLKEDPLPLKNNQFQNLWGKIEIQNTKIFI